MKNHIELSKLITKTLKTSLRQQVFQYCRDHPSLLKLSKEAQNTELCGAFAAVEETEQNTIKRYKVQYYDSLDPLFNPPKGSRSSKPKILEKDVKEDITPIPLVDPGFTKFCRWLSHPEYGGLYEWQQKHHDLTWKSKFEMTCVSRDHGKSISYNAKYQWAIQYKNFDVLLLGWTERRKEIAMYVYSFFEKHGLIEMDKRTSPFHFKTKNGGKFDCYLITGKEVLGMHSEGEQNRFANMTEANWEEYKGMFQGLDTESDVIFDEAELKSYVDSRKGSNRKLWISIDDPIDITFMKERHKEKMLEMRFNSTIYSINPDKWSFTGTRKFEGDFFDFIEGKFGSKLVTYIQGPYYEDGSLLCPERFTVPKLKSYKDDIKAGKKDLTEIRSDIGEYAWFSEYVQNPHPITGDQWDHLAFVELIDTPLDRKHDLCFITIDRATTEKISSDYTGCFVGLREMKTGCRIITHDWTAKIPLEDLLIKVNDFLILFRKMHERIMIILVIEKQGGGNEFVSQARTRMEFTKPDPNNAGQFIRIPNRICEIAHIIDIHNIGEKIQRIKNRLTAPICNERVKWLSSLQQSEGTRQVLYFPNNANFDAPDALANIEFVLLEYPLILGEDGSYIDQLTTMYQDIGKGILPLERSELQKGLDKIALKDVKGLSNKRGGKRKTLF